MSLWLLLMPSLILTCSVCALICLVIAHREVSSFGKKSRKQEKDSQRIITDKAHIIAVTSKTIKIIRVMPERQFERNVRQKAEQKGVHDCSRALLLVLLFVCLHAHFGGISCSFFNLFLLLLLKNECFRNAQTHYRFDFSFIVRCVCIILQIWNMCVGFGWMAFFI